MTVVLKVNVENIECEINVYVNVTYDCSSQSKCWKSWVWDECLCKCYIWL
jgi:hypothetical protein